LIYSIFHGSIEISGKSMYSLLFKEVRIFLTKGATAACTTAVLIGVVAEQAGMPGRE